MVNRHHKLMTQTEYGQKANLAQFNNNGSVLYTDTTYTQLIS